MLGALIGGVAAGVGAGVANLVAGGAFFGAEAMAVVGFWNGAVVGAASGFAAGFTGAALNTWTGGGNLGDGLAAGFRAGVQGALIGAAVGGITGGLRAKKQGKGFWSGLDNSRPQVSSVSELTPYGVKKFANSKIDLSLNNSPNFRIDIQTTVPDFDFSKVEIIRRVNGNVFGQGGGGWEIIYRGKIDITKVKAIITELK
ncbi:complement resistance protein TraT [Flavobacteriaceae bacterium]|nr:complement resistance protein TraT [Flavobacteriaceae bacterium]